MCVVALAMVYAIGVASGVASGKIRGGSPFPPGTNHWTFVLGATPAYIQQMIGHVRLAGRASQQPHPLRAGWG